MNNTIVTKKYTNRRGSFLQPNLEAGSESIIIDNCVVTRFKCGGHRICKIEFYEYHFGMSAENFTRVTSGSRLFDNQIIAKLSDGKIKYGHITEAWSNGKLRSLIL